MSFSKNLLFTYEAADASLTTLLVKLESVNASRPEPCNEKLTFRPVPMVVGEVTHCGTSGTAEFHLIELSGRKIGFPCCSGFERDPEGLAREVEEMLSKHLPLGYRLHCRRSA